MNGQRILKRFQPDGKETIIRYATADDLEGILEVGGKEQQINLSVRVSWVMQLRTAKIVLVAEVEGKIRGVIIVSSIPAKYHVCYAPWWVWTIGVTQEFRRFGIGTALIQTALYQAKRTLEAKLIGLRVKQFHPVISLYKKCGFKKVRIREIDRERFSELKEAVIMVKNL